MVAKLSGEVEALRVLECLAGIEKRPDAPAERVGLIVEFLRPFVIQLLGHDGFERRDALPAGKSANAACPGFGRTKFIRVEFGEDLNEALPKRMGGVLVLEIGHLLGQVEFGFAVVVPNGERCAK